jgi:hypothetical protein
MVFARSLSRQLRRPATSLLAAPARPWRAPQPVFSGIRTLTSTATRQGKVLMVLYEVSTVSVSCTNRATANPSFLHREASMPNNSPVFLVQPRTSSAFASGLKIRATLLLPPQTRMVLTLSLRRNWLMPKSSSQLRKSPYERERVIESQTNE